MAPKTKPNKKEAIITSARKLFLSKGYQNTSMRDIAKDAEVNLAMVNYYFSSKGTLFDMIFDEVFQRMADTIVPHVRTTETVEETISDFVDNYIEWYITNAGQLSFIFQILYSDPEKLIEKMEGNSVMTVIFASLMEALQRDIEEGTVRKIEHPEHLILNVVSLCAFPFIAKPLVKRLFDKDEASFIEMMRSRKTEIVAIFHAYLLEK